MWYMHFKNETMLCTPHPTINGITILVILEQKGAVATVAAAAVSTMATPTNRAKWNRLQRLLCAYHFMAKPLYEIRRERKSQAKLCILYNIHSLSLYFSFCLFFLWCVCSSCSVVSCARCVRCIFRLSEWSGVHNNNIMHNIQIHAEINTSAI